MYNLNIGHLGHIVVNGKHKYYITVSDLEKLSEDSTEIEILSTEVSHLKSQDVVGRAPPTNKKKLYNVR